VAKNPKPKLTKPKFVLIPEDDWCDADRCEKKACWQHGTRKVCDSHRFILEHRKAGTHTGRAASQGAERSKKR
jgi:hypothetical protein